MLESFFAGFRQNIIGVDQRLNGPCGERPLVYADWTASGRSTGPSSRLLEGLRAAGGQHPLRVQHHRHGHDARLPARPGLLKAHVRAGPDDVIITQGSGMTAVVNKLQRMLGLRLPEQLAPSASSRRSCGRWCCSPTWSTTPTRRRGSRPSPTWT